MNINHVEHKQAFNSRTSCNGISQKSQQPQLAGIRKMVSVDPALNISYYYMEDSLEVNPSVLIGSFLVGILPYGSFTWKRSYAVYFFGSANSNYEKKTFKYSHLRKETT